MNLRYFWKEGLSMQGQVSNVRIQAFVCDAPARQFLKGIKGHNGIKRCIMM